MIKPILDAFVGVVYHDDRQVRSVKATALPIGEPYGLSGWASGDVINRLTEDNPREFLVTIYEGLSTPAP